MDRFFKILSKAMACLFTLSAFVIIVFVAIIVPSNSSAFYSAQFNEPDEYGKTPIDYVKKYSYSMQDDKAASYVLQMSEDDLIGLMKHVMRYCLYLEDDLNPTVNGEKINVFRQDEVSHMKDVKGVFGGLLITVGVSVLIFISTLILAILKKKEYYQNCRKVPFYTLIGVFSLLLVLGITVAIDFEWAFDIFHMILFDGNWIFEDGIMIEMIGYIFDDLVPIILGASVIMLGLFVLGLYLYNRGLKNKFEKE